MTEISVEEILTPKEVAARLKVPVSWLYEQTRNRGRLRSRDALPHRKMGRYLRFVWSEVVQWLDRQHPTATTTPVSTPTRSGA